MTFDEMIAASLKREAEEMCTLEIKDQIWQGIYKCIAAAADNGEKTVRDDSNT